jgi:hypothetical protein
MAASPTLLAVALASVSCGCYASHYVWAEPDGTGPRDDAAGRTDAEADLPEAAVEQCPDSLPTEGLVRLPLRWRRLASSGWTAPGSAALAVVDGVVLAAVPRAPTTPGAAPLLLRLAGDSGTPLLDGPAELADLGAATAVAAARSVDGAAPFVAGAGLAPDTGLVVIRAARLESSGATHDPLAGETGLEATETADLRAAADAERLFVVHEGAGPAGWALDAVTIGRESGALDSWRLYDADADSGEGFVAVDPTAGTVLWTQPEALDLRTSSGSNLARQELRPASPFVPAAMMVGLDLTTRYVLAGRSAREGRDGVWIDLRATRTLAEAGSADLPELEPLVDRPEPRALEPAGARLVLAWAARRTFGTDAVPSCLYLTPLDAGGAPTGTTMRVDPGDAEARPAGIEHVRVVVDGESIYVLWRQDPDLWLARLGWES